MMLISSLLAILQIFLIGYICYYEYKAKSPAVFMWLTLLLMFGLMHLLTVFTGQTDFPMWVLDTASLFVCLFCVLYIITRKVVRHKTGIPPFYYKEEQDSSRFVSYLLILFFAVVLYRAYAVYAHTGSFFSVSWGTMREMSAETTFGSVIISAYFAASGILLISLLGKKKMLSILVALLILFTATVSRNRVEMLPLFVSLLAFLLFKSRLFEKLSPKSIFIMGFIGLFVVYAVFGMRVFRHQGSMEALIASSLTFVEFNSIVLEQIMGGEGELGLRSVFYYFIYNNNNFVNFGQGHTYIRMLLVLIPTALSFGLKPPDFAISMGTAYNPHLPGFSTHPTLFGDCFANFGFFGFFLGIFWALLISTIDYIVNSRKNQELKMALFLITSANFIVMARGSVYNAFFLLTWGSIFLFLLYAISKCVIKRSSVNDNCLSKQKIKESIGL